MAYRQIFFERKIQNLRLGGGKHHGAYFFIKSTKVFFEAY